MRRFVPMFALLAVLTPAVAHAQAPPPAQTPPPTDHSEMKDSYIAPWFGTVKLTDKDSIVDSPNKKVFGVSFGFWQRGILGAEIDLGLGRKLFDEGPGSDGTANLMTITGNAIIGPWINFSSQQALRPYLVLGGGLARTTLKDFLLLDDATQNRGLIDIGGGAHLYFSKAFGVRVDYRLMKVVGAKDDSDGGGFGFTGEAYKRFTVAALFGF